MPCDHPYTVDVVLHGAEPYPCVICGLGRAAHDGGAVSDAGRWRRRARLEFKAADCWVGVFWKRSRTWMGHAEALGNVSNRTFAHRRLDVWVCLLPMVPLHYTAEWCPFPAQRQANTCTVRGPMTRAGRAVVRRWLLWRWHLWRMGDKWEIHSYGCDVCEER